MLTLRRVCAKGWFLSTARVRTGACMTACWDDKPDLLVLSDVGFQTVASGYRAGIV